MGILDSDPESNIPIVSPSLDSSSSSRPSNSDDANENDVTEDNRVQDWVHHLNYLELIIPPKPRQVWQQITSPCGSKKQWVSSLSVTKERRGATPSDLVLDLVYVILLQQLGRAYRTELDSNALYAFRDFCSMFIPIWFQWGAVQLYLNKFEQKDVVFVFFFIGNVLTMANIGISAEECGSGTHRLGCSEFAFSMAGARFWVFLFHGYALYHNWNAFRLASYVYMLPDALIVLSWIIVGFMPAGEECGDDLNGCWAPFIFWWWFALFIDFLRLMTPLIVYRILKWRTTKKESIPLNINLVSERNELFIIISIGEIIAASLASEPPTAAATDDDGGHHRLLSDDSHGKTISVYSIVPLVALIAALVKITYFDVAEHPAPSGGSCTPRKHAMASSPFAGLAWVVLHLPLNICIVLLGAVLEPLKLHGEFNQTAQQVCANCLGGIVLICSLFDVLHSGGSVQLRLVKKEFRLAFHLVCVGVFFVVPYIKDFEESPLDYLGIINSLLLVQVMGTLYCHMPRIRPGSESGGV
ncbi:hypothetical protein TrLO_g8152 [Triparma laevis f. longispina]|nr:hypothetical protein TrLO_g8152 [Triparma laevis f. longispina]